MTADKKPSNSGRDTKGRFSQGNNLSKGKPKGARHKATQAALQLMDGQLETITQTLIDAALEGDLVAIKLVMDKVIPPCRELPLQGIELPNVTEAADLPALTQRILEAVASGEVLPSQAAALSALVTSHAKAIELADFEARLARLEEAAHEE